MRRLYLLLLVGLGVAAIGGCANNTGETSPDAITASGTFAAPATDGTAVTYDPALVPVGATAKLTLTPTGSGLRVELTVAGLRPGRTYGAHLHTKPCGPTGAAAGPHYQHQPGPVGSGSAPPADPTYVNAENEVWLDFTTDGAGNAASTSTQDWAYDPAGGPRSLVIHAEATKTAPGIAGAAGARVACLTLPE